MISKLLARVRPPREPSRRAFAAAQLSRLTEQWITTRDDIARELRSDLDALRDRSRQLEKDNDFAARYLELVETNIIGDTGVTLIPLAADAPGRPDQMARDAIMAAWQEWGRQGSCEVSGSMSWLELCWAIVRGTARDGEYLVEEIIGRDAGNRFNYALRVHDVARIATWLNREASQGANAISCGVEVDTFGRPVRYYLTAGPRPSRYSRDVVAIDAARVIHRFRSRWADQPRGVPWTHAAMLSMHYAGEFALSALLAAKYGADHLGFFVTPDGQAPALGGDEQSDGSRVVSSAPGTWETLPAGVDVKDIDTKYPSEAFDPFLKAANRRIASGLNVSYPALCNDHADLNYNSIRATQTDDRDQWRKAQSWFRENWLERVFDRWFDVAMAAGAITMPNGSALPITKAAKFRAHAWQFRGWASNDPLKDVEAFREAVSLGVDSRTAYVARSGRAIEDVIDDLKRERELAAQADVDVNGRQPAAPAPAPTT